MTKRLVFLHGPGGGGCAAVFAHQLRHFPGSLAPDLPGAKRGSACRDVEGYAEWVRGWLWAQGFDRDLVLVGYTLGAAIALRYAADHPEEVSGLVLSSITAGPRTPNEAILARCLAASTGDPAAYATWLESQRHMQMWIEPGFREHLVACQQEVGPLAQHRMITRLYAFDPSSWLDRLAAPVLLVKGTEDPLAPKETEEALHRRLPASRLVHLERAGHFPPAERPGEFNRLVEGFVASLPP